jgi:hypothetical protein
MAVRTITVSAARTWDAKVASYDASVVADRAALVEKLRKASYAVRDGEALPDGVSVLFDATYAAGGVLKSFTRSERVMSDVWDSVRYLTYWNGADVVETYPGSFSREANKADSFDSYDPAVEKLTETYVVVDATDEVKALADAWEVKAAEARRAAAEEKAAKDRLAREETEARTPYRGTTVKVVRGRKVKIGTTGVVIWYGEGNYGTRIGLALDEEKGPDGRYLNVGWTAASNVEVVLSDAEEARWKARREKLYPVAPVVEAPVVEAPVVVAPVAVEPVEEVEVAMVAVEMEGREPVAAEGLAGWPTEKAKLAWVMGVVEELAAKVERLEAEVASLKSGKARKARRVALAA